MGPGQGLAGLGRQGSVACCSALPPSECWLLSECWRLGRRWGPTGGGGEQLVLTLTGAGLNTANPAANQVGFGGAGAQECTARLLEACQRCSKRQSLVQSWAGGCPGAPHSQLRTAPP